MGSQTFEIEVLLLVLPSTDYKKRVPVAIGTTITDVVVDFIAKITLKMFQNPGKPCVVPPSLNGWCRHNLKINT